jgi:antitoxin PrlF
MSREKKRTTNAETPGSSYECCRVESVVSIDERGQMVLPKDIREKAGIQAGDKLAVVFYESRGKVCCISLLKANDLAEMVSGMLGPAMKDIVKTTRT